MSNIGSAKSRSLRWLGLAASLALILGASWWIFLKPSARIQTVAAIEGAMDHRLDDGSVIALNQGSTIQFLSDMENERKVVLEGDAFFDVNRDPDRPFRIATQNLQIEVLGTSFYVDAREGQSTVQVIVQSGKVAFGKDQDRVLLEAGQTGVYDKNSGQMTQYQTNDPNYLSWKSHVLLFEETPLDQVVFAINRQFRSMVRVGDTALQSCTLNATYTNQSLESIIKILEKTFNLQVVVQGDQIILLGDGCN